MSKKILLQKGTAKVIGGKQICSVYVTNGVVEISCIERKSISPSNKTKRISGKEYVELATGEVKRYKESVPRAWNSDSLKNSCIHLRRLINNNFIGDDSERHIVLTYNIRMRDYAKANEDFKKFWGKFRYHNPTCEYIRIIEPQSSGSWHIHMLVKDVENSHFSGERESIESWWPQGRVWIGKLPFADNYGAYFSAYFTDLDLNENTGNPLTPISKKRIIKHGRLKFYPPKFRLYNASRGIKQPEKLQMTYEQALGLVQDRELCLSYTTHVIQRDEEMGTETEVNTITYQQFKSKRKEENTVQADPSINNYQ